MSRMQRMFACGLAIALAIALTITLHIRPADACGCLSPPVPVADDDYAVNQQAEQIIFEVEEDHVVAHVLIQYAGSPESFAWLVPVPSAPELSLSSTTAFALLDQNTKPRAQVTTRNMCPEREYYCMYGSAPDECRYPNANADGNPWPSADASTQNPTAPPVEVIDRQIVGSYDTVVFSAGDSQAAIDWLNQEGFIVNQTMAPFMQPYADDGMLFVASRLLPGADVSEIRPLRMRYLSQQPMIPLRLTAVAAEPHLTVTAYIFGARYFQPENGQLINLEQSRLSADPQGRNNYPMLLSRTIDEQGGAGFVAEYIGAPVLPDFDQGSGCCDSGFDLCGIEFDGICSCPGNELDEFDCAEETELLEGLALLTELNLNHQNLTRLTTRMSAEDMTFDPVFSAMPDDTIGFGRLSLQNETQRLTLCDSDIIERDRYDDILKRQACASFYCGTGECVATSEGPGCVCEPGSVARVFTDLDGQESITCVPDQAPVDFSAGGITIPDACNDVNCGAGASTCVDVGGFPTCRCAPDTAAANSDEMGARAPVCRPVAQATGSPGAEDFSAEVAQVRVCAPTPPASCGNTGWLVARENIGIRGEACASSSPDPDLLVPPSLTCEDFGLLPPEKTGCTCRTGHRPAGSHPWLLLLLALLIARRTRIAKSRTL